MRSCAPALLLAAAAVDAGDAYLEVELTSPPLPPDVTTIAGGEDGWDYYFAAGGNDGCGPNNPVASETAARSCFETAWANNYDLCPANQLVSQGNWQDSGVPRMGLVPSQTRPYLHYHDGVDGEPPPGTYTCVSSNPVQVTMVRDRVIQCNPPYEGYAPGPNACVNAQKKKLRIPPVTCSAGARDSRRGNPCDAATGDKSQREVDYESPVLSFIRTYHSFLQLADAGLGVGWTHNFSTRLVLVSDVPRVIVEGSGYTQPLTALPGPVYASISGSGDQVRAGSPGQWIAFRADGSQDIFDDEGVLQQRVASNGLVTQLEYDSGGRLQRIEGPFGHALNLEFDSLGSRLVSLSDPAEREIHFDYDDAGNLEYVTYPDMSVRQYHYEDEEFPNALTGITDEDGERFSTYGYDDQGRVILSEHAGGVGRIILDYDDQSGETTVTYADDSAETFAFTANANQWRWWLGSDATPCAGNTPCASLQSALEAARADCDYCWNLVPGRVSGYNPPASGDDNYRRLLSAELDGAGPELVYVAGDPRLRVDNEVDANGNRTDYEYGDAYHRTRVTEADQDTTYRRSTETSFLEETSNLPQTVATRSVLGGTNQRLETTEYHPTTRLPSSYAISGFDPLTAGAVGRTIRYPSYDSYALQPTLIKGPRAGQNQNACDGQADNTCLTYWDESSPGVSCVTTGGGACGQVKTLTNALGQVTQFNAYDADARILMTTDANNLVTEYLYDDRGRVETVTEKLAGGGAERVTDIDYYPSGLLKTVALPNDRVQNYFWTAARVLDYITDNQGNRVEVGNDALGNEASFAFKWPGGSTSWVENWVFDVRGRPRAWQQGSRPATDLDFDAVGRLEGITDSGSRFTDYQHDSLNRMWKVIDPENGATDPTVLGYDWQDNVTSVAAPNGATTTYAFDDLGNLRREISPDRGTSLMGYDAAGNMTCRADGRYAGGAVSCESVANRWVYGYDMLNRVTSIDYLETGAGADATFSWDTRPGSAVTQAGRLRQVTHSSPTTGIAVVRKMDYDAWGNVTWMETSVTEENVTKTYTAQYAYDGANQLSSITYPSGRVLTYGRWPNGTLKNVKATFDGGPEVTVVSLVSNKPFGPPQSIFYGNGLVQIRDTDTAGSPAVLSLVDASSFDALDFHTYSVSDAGNVMQDADDLQSTYTRDYSYDALDRLTFDSGASPADPTYTYDANGNRETRAAGTYDAQSFAYLAGSNRRSGVLYDGMGNRQDGLGLYDANGRLMSLFDAVTTDSMILAYNGLGELARTVLYHNDPCSVEQLLLSRDDYLFMPDGRALSIRTSNTASVNTDYVWVDGLPVAQFVDSFDSQGVVIGTTLTYLHPDHLGTPRIGTSQGKAITWRYRSDAFGIPDAQTSGVVRLRFPGQISLGVAGVHYNYYRDYDPDEGRYLESDPIGLDGGINTYAYVEQKPLTRRDFFGLESGTVALGLDPFRNKPVPLSTCEKAAYVDLLINISPLSLVELTANVGFDYTFNPFNRGENLSGEILISTQAAAGGALLDGYLRSGINQEARARNFELLSRQRSRLSEDRRQRLLRALARDERSLSLASGVRGLTGPGLALGGFAYDLSRCTCSD